MADLSLATKVLLLASRVCGGLSVLSCICTALEATTDWRLGKDTFVTRIQVALQPPIAIYSVATIFGTSLAPDAWLSFGNDATCNAQAFTMLFSICSGVLLDMSLSLCYLLRIKHGWTEEALRKIEPYFHLFVWPFTLVLCVYSASQNLFGYTLESCYLLMPKECTETEDDCVSIPNSLYPVRLTMLSINLIHLTFSMYVICQICGVAMASEEEQTFRLVAVKGALYALIVTTVEVPVALWLSFYYLTGYDANGLIVVSMLALPLIGFFNFLVFMLNRRKMNTSYGVVWRKVLDWVATACCFCFNAHDDV